MQHIDLGPPESPLDNPDKPYALDPHRGVDAIDSDTITETSPENDGKNLDIREEPQESNQENIINESPIMNPAHLVGNEPQPLEENFSLVPADSFPTDMINDAEISSQEESQNSVDDNSLALTRNAINPGYNFRKSTLERHVYAALTIKSATSQYGAEVTDGAVVEE